MAFDINNLVIDHILRGVMTSTADGSFMWSINQITEPSLSVTTETSEAVDALGSKIATFDRAKNAEFSANNSIFDLGLFAAQNGRDKEVASSTSKIISPAFETLTYDGTTSEIVLAHEPVEPIKNIYALKGDGTLGIAYTSGVSAGTDTFVYDGSAHKITVPTGLTKGTQLFVMYDYETEEAVQAIGDAINFPKAGKFVMEILGSDVCNPSEKIHAYVVFPNAKLDANVDLSFTTDGNHPFKLIAQQSYCDSEKVLYKIVIPKED